LDAQALEAPRAQDAAGMKGRLNSFQKLALRWSELHPYNAVHLVRVPQAPDLERLRRAIADTVSRLGLGRLELDARAGTYEFAPDSRAVELAVHAGQEGDAAALQREIERQLNLGFEITRPFQPFRFFVLTGPGSFSFGLVYFHPAADAESVALLMQEIIGHCTSAARPSTAPPQLYPRTHAGHWLWQPWLLLGWLSHLPAFIVGLRHSFRPHYQDILDLRNGFTSVTLPPAALATLTQAARALEVTLNDLFLAVLLRAVSPLAGARRAQPRRRCLSVGCIVNTRRDFGVQTGSCFGLFLASFTVTLPAPDDLPLPQLAQAVRDQTRRFKQARLYLAAPFQYALARFLLGFCSADRRRKFYPKHHPLWGGITNMNLNSLWPQPAAGPALDYLRAVSTGPATPLVLSITTLGQVVNIGLSYRPTVFSPTAIEHVKAALVGAAETFRAAALGR
jgi:hypothetical protein